MGDVARSAPLRAVALERVYGERRAVAGVSFELRRGELLALLGPNGAGKTSLVEMLVGLETPDAGECRVDGRVGYAPQQLNLWPDLTPLEQLEFLGVMHGVPREQARNRAWSLLHELGLEDRAGELAGRLSGGMQRRLNLALAWMDEPSVAVLDEPTVGLDPISRRRVHDFLRERIAHGASILLSTHDLAEAEQLAGRIAILDGGHLLSVDSPDELLHRANPARCRSLEDVFLALAGREFR